MVNRSFGFVIAHMNVCLNVCVESRMIAQPEASNGAFLDTVYTLSLCL